ncbi:MAG: hypothetical protein A3G34_14085 [Candidatus Lindowbacteria bacterium RIFCSPLOWO2_12_FULL_62_27]|nr:MAG: hypothetical protein A3I06_00530 [Candidatus Lindowbacteria bacterium RIFCSPLOWO2_02_FULL_62_12]OGH62696.1 MAG: hypothetical protein A3G34_14085 [Candidatus Lindowbacteria bacterium RIFCSPLOWO2_12_FULL_62_27]
MTNLPAEPLRRWMIDVLGAESADPSVAAHVAESLTQTSLRGVDSHGVRLFPHYVRTLRAGGVNGRPAYKFARRAPSCGVLAADHTFGHASGAEAMKHAIEMARECGIGAVAVQHSSHFGAAAYFGFLAAEADMIGLAFTHSDALLQTYGGTQPYLGPNPICFVAPCLGEAPFCLDMSCSSFSWNKIRQYRERQEPLPAGVAADSRGCATVDPAAARSLTPIGEYKGYGLALMVEILCSLLTGMPYGVHIKPMFDVPPETRRDLGHFFMAINISNFQPVAVFKTRLKSLMDELRGEPRLNGAIPVMAPGDPEKHVLQIRRAAGIPLSAADWTEFQKLGRQYNLSLPAPVEKELVPR